MAESTLTLTFDDLADNVARMLGLAPTRAERSSQENDDVDGYVHAGHVQFHAPPWQDAGLPFHLWTFLQTNTTVTTTASQASDDLPDNFGYPIGARLTYTDSDDGQGYDPVMLVEPYRIQAWLQQDDDWDGPPEYAAIRPASFTESTGQRWEILWYPIPDDAYEFAYVYAPQDDEGSGSNYIRGGMFHRETLRASCRAVAKREADGEIGAEWAYFLTRLRASYAVDIRTSPGNYGYMGHVPHRREHRWGITHGNTDANAPTS